MGHLSSISRGFSKRQKLSQKGPTLTQHLFSGTVKPQRAGLWLLGAEGVEKALSTKGSPRVLVPWVPKSTAELLC